MPVCDRSVTNRLEYIRREEREKDKYQRQRHRDTHTRETYKKKTSWQWTSLVGNQLAITCSSKNADESHVVRDKNLSLSHLFIFFTLLHENNDSTRKIMADLFVLQATNK